MIRAFALATVLVLAFVVLVTSIHLGLLGGGGETRYTSSRGTPSPPQNGGDGLRTPLPVQGEAPWALSALPECFTQLSRRSGPRAFVARGFPRGARAVVPPARLHVADCSLALDGSLVTVTRGENVLTIHDARMYVDGSRLVLDRTAGPDADLRTFELAGAARPEFVRLSR